MKYIAGVILIWIAQTVGAGILEVGGDGRFHDLKKAITFAKEGDAILLSQGAYYGNFTIDKRLIIKGKDKTNPPVLDGEGKGHVLTIHAAGSMIENIEITNSGHTIRAFECALAGVWNINRG